MFPRAKHRNRVQYDDAFDDIEQSIIGSGKDESILKSVVYRIAQTELREAIDEEETTYCTVAQKLFQNSSHRLCID